MNYPIVGGELPLTVLVNVATQFALDPLALGQPIPRGIWGKGFIDTGTTVSCVSQTILRRFGLSSIASGTTQTASGSLSAGLFNVSLSISSHQPTAGPMLTWADVIVLELPNPPPGVDVLIGMDLIQSIKLTIDGPASQFTLES
jgi:hypothetical protein